MPGEPGITDIDLKLAASGEIGQIAPENYLGFLDALPTYLETAKNPQALIDQSINVIVDRFGSDLQTLGDRPYPERWLAHDIGQETRTFLWRISHFEEIRIKPEILEKIYRLTSDSSRMVRFHAIQAISSAWIFDNRNKKDRPDKGLNLYQRFAEDTINKLATAKTMDEYEDCSWMIDEFWADSPGELEPIMVGAIEKAESAEAAQRAFSLVANRIGFERARQILREQSGNNAQFASKARQLDSRLGSERGQFFSRLEDLYREISFENYQPNEELLEFETDLLLKEFAGAEKILDIGCGPAARLTKSLHGHGKEVVGIDFSTEHAQKAKASDPNLQIVKANWHHLPFPDKSFAAAFLLGRSFLHNSTVDDCHDFLHELARITDIAIVDLADPEKGHYAQERQKLDEAAKEAGIEYLEAGTIIDSPDSVHYFDRLVPFPDQFKAMAKLAGFKAEIIAEKEFRDPDGQVNINCYWKLTKLEKPLDPKELLEAFSQSRTAGPPLYATLI